MAVGRELKMKELKEKIEHLESELMKHKSKLTEKSSLLKGSEGSRGLRFK